jgi:hypothetical protein
MDADRPRATGPGVEPALVECLLLTVRESSGLARTAQTLVSLARAHILRILDVVCLARSAEDARLTRRDVADAASVDLLAEVHAGGAPILSDRDVRSAALLVEPGASALLLLVEDRWAAGLAHTCRAAGGRIVGGERIAPSLVATTMPRADLRTTPAPAVRPAVSPLDTGTPGDRRSRADNLDLLTVFPRTDPSQNAHWVDLIVDPAESLAEITDLFERGLISRAQLESQKDLIFGTAREQRP